MILYWPCPECEKETLVEVTFGRPARTFGKPEDCYPEEHPHVEPCECEHCGTKFSEDKILEDANQRVFDRLTEQADRSED